MISLNTNTFAPSRDLMALHVPAVAQARRDSASTRRGIAVEIRTAKDHAPSQTALVATYNETRDQDLARRDNGRNAPAPVSGFFAQAYAREHLLLDLRPDADLAKRASGAYLNAEALAKRGEPGLNTVV